MRMLGVGDWVYCDAGDVDRARIQRGQGRESDVTTEGYYRWTGDEGLSGPHPKSHYDDERAQQET